jgi:hypothetical protein
VNTVEWSALTEEEKYGIWSDYHKAFPEHYIENGIKPLSYEAYCDVLAKVSTL